MKDDLCRCGHPKHEGQCPATDGCWCDSFARPNEIAPASECPRCHAGFGESHPSHITASGSEYVTGILCPVKETTK